MKFRTIVAAIILLTVGSQANAALLSINGAVISPNGVPGFSVGDSVSLRIRIDPTIQDQSTFVNRGTFLNAATALRLEVAGQEIFNLIGLGAIPQNQFGVSNNISFPGLSLAVLGSASERVIMNLGPLPGVGNFFDGVVDGTVAEYLTRYADVINGVDDSDNNTFFQLGGTSTVNFSMDEATFTVPVPEPGALALFAIGLAGLMFIRRRNVSWTVHRDIA